MNVQVGDLFIDKVYGKNNKADLGYVIEVLHWREFTFLDILWSDGSISPEKLHEIQEELEKGTWNYIPR